MSFTIPEGEPLLGIISSIRVRSKSSLHKDAKFKGNIHEEVEKRLKQKFKKNGFHLESIEDFVNNDSSKWIKEVPKLYPNGGLKYSSSTYLDFKDNNTLVDDWIRYEKTLTNSSIMKNFAAGVTSTHKDRKYNEFFLTKESEKKIDHADTWYDILLLLGIRRDQLFGKDLARRIYNIGLPVAKIERISSKSETPHHQFLLCPVITLHRKPERVKFRKTISVSLILVPIKNSSDDRISLQEIYAMLWERGPNAEFKFEKMDHLAKFLDLKDEKFTMIALNKIVMEKALSLICDNKVDDKEQDSLNIQIETSLQKIVTFMKGDSQEERFHIFKDDEKLHLPVGKDLRMLVYPYHYFVDGGSGKETFDAVFKLKELLVNDKFLFDSSYLMFYNPRESYLAGIHYKDLEFFPLLSMKWYFFSDLYMLMEISLFKVMLHSFYHEIEERGGLNHVTDVENDLVSDLDEFYDLDLKFSTYKDSYEKIKKISGLDVIYTTVKEKLDDLTDSIVLTQQRRINLAIVLLTVFTVAASLLLFDYSDADVRHRYIFFGIIVGMPIILIPVYLLYGKLKV